MHLVCMDASERDADNVATRVEGQSFDQGRLPRTRRTVKKQA